MVATTQHSEHVEHWEQEYCHMRGGMNEAICPRMSPGRMFMMLYYSLLLLVKKLWKTAPFQTGGEIKKALALLREAGFARVDLAPVPNPYVPEGNPLEYILVQTGR